MVSHLFHDPRWTGKSGRETYSKKNWRRTNWKTCPTLNRLLRPPLTFQMIKLKCFDSRNSREDVMMNRWQNWKVKQQSSHIQRSGFLNCHRQNFCDRFSDWHQPLSISILTQRAGWASDVEKLQLICTVYAHHEARFSSRRPFLERSIQ